MGRRRNHDDSDVRYRPRRQNGPAARRRMGIIFAVALGWCGVHRFTLGQWQWGLAHIFLFIVSMSALDNTMFGDTPWVSISALFAYYTAYRWWRMSDEEFADNYLEPVDQDVRAPVAGRYLKGVETSNPKVLSRRARRKVLAQAKERYEGFDYQGAAELYEEALDMDLADGEARVLAARCYALLEDQDAAYRHLRRAVQVRATNLNLVDDDAGFAWLRTRADFNARRRAEFAVPPPVAAAEATPQLAQPQENLLDRLEQLGRLRERGLLDDEEFAREKRRLLR